MGSGGAVVDAWIPGARCIRAHRDGGALRGGAPRVVWHALGADPRLISARSAAERLDQEGRPPHLVWNPLSGDIAQLIPVVRAACLLGGPETMEYAPGSGSPVPASAGTNRQGRLCVQIGVLSWASEPFTDGPMLRGRAHFELAALLARAVALASRAARLVCAGPHPGSQSRGVVHRRPLRCLAGSRLGRGRAGKHRHRAARHGARHALPGHLPAPQDPGRQW